MRALGVFSIIALSLLAGDATATNEEGEAWLAANAKREGVVVHESGLQYKILTAGPGGADAPSPTFDTPCRVAYTGRTLAGRVRVEPRLPAALVSRARRARRLADRTAAHAQGRPLGDLRAE